MEKSESISKLTSALIKAQEELETVARDTQAYNYKYATLPAVFCEYKKCFLKHGLAVIQLVEGHGLRTTLTHESGEWVSAVGNLAYTGNDPQAQGSAITYMRRYGMSAACGIMQEDDDGKKAMPKGKDSDIKSENNDKHNIKKQAELMTPKEKTVTGFIENIDVTGPYGYVKYKINGEEYSTRDHEIIGPMGELYGGNTEADIKYIEKPWLRKSGEIGGYNRTITDARAHIEDTPF